MCTFVPYLLFWQTVPFYLFIFHSGMNKHVLSFAFFFLVFLTVLFSCNKEDSIDPTKPNVQLNKLPYNKLSDYHFFSGNPANMIPNEKVLPYDINSPLFSDYAHKARYVYMPEGSSAVYTENEAFEFPAGAVLIKTFYYYNNETDTAQGRRIIETRLLVKLSTGWEAYDYIWNDEQTDATYSLVGKSVPVSWVNEQGLPQNAHFLIPNKNECKGCHSLSGQFVPLGPKARHLNHTYPYPTGSINQLQKWTETGYLTGAPNPNNAPTTPVWNNPSTGTLDQRARAYLDTNCAHCHNPNGPANNSGLSLGWLETNAYAMGICKPPVAAGQGSGGLQYSIVPGMPDESILIYRMNSVDLDVQMPELGRSVIHAEGVQLLRDWIASLEPVGCQ